MPLIWSVLRVLVCLGSYFRENGNNMKAETLPTLLTAACVLEKQEEYLGHRCVLNDT